MMLICSDCKRTSRNDEKIASALNNFFIFHQHRTITVNGPPLALTLYLALLLCYRNILFFRMSTHITVDNERQVATNCLLIQNISSSTFIRHRFKELSSRRAWHELLRLWKLKYLSFFKRKTFSAATTQCKNNFIYCYVIFEYSQGKL